MAYLRGYKCDVCEREARDDQAFIGLQIHAKTASEMAVDSAHFHICIQCAECIGEIVATRLISRRPDVP